MSDLDLERLAELTRRTDDVRPAKGFTDAVMAAVEADGADEAAPSSRLSDGLQRAGLVAVALAACAAAASVMLSLNAQSHFDETVLSSVDTVEIGE